jgi:glycosyltransferase involved in cell wall biosynthesis
VEREPFAVSVAIPAYNEAARIGKAIASIRAQQEPPAEIIVVDDGSQDATSEIARALGARVLRQANAGVGAARNYAIREATSPWIAFCDADDLWYPGKLADARRASEARPGVDFLFSDYCVENGGRIDVPSTFAVSPEFENHVCERIGDRICFFEGGVLARALAQCNFVAPSTVLARRSLLLERSIFFASGLPQDSNYYVSEDLEWYLRVLRATDAVATERVLMQYHRHAGSLSANAGRVRHGEVKLGEMIAQAPERYVDGLAEVFAGHRRRHLRDSARYYGRALRFREMQATLREAQRVEFRLRDEALWLLAGIAALPGARWFAGTVKWTWHHFLKPTLRRNRPAR